MPPPCSLSALEVEKILDLLSHGGHDGGVEECVEAAEQESADNHGDEDLNAGIDVAFCLYVFDCGLGTDCHFGCLGLKIGEKLFHK